jgi:signal transduction histidine kinase
LHDGQDRLFEAPEEHQLLLATLTPSKGQIRLAYAVLLVIAASTTFTLIFANIQLPRVDAFVPTLSTAIAFNDLVTAALLFAQFSITQSRALLVLASGFFLTSLIVIPHALTFPGAFTPTGLFGAGLQTAPWLYLFWHVGTPLAVIGYALLKDTEISNAASRWSAKAMIGFSIVIVALVACGLTFIAIEADKFLPSILSSTIEANRSHLIVSGVLVGSLPAIALVLLGRRRRTVLDLWLKVMCCALLAEIVVTCSVATRFSLGFYASRIFFFVAVFSVLLILLSETMSLYANLIYSALRRRSSREGRQIAMDAMAASVAHEVNQPIAAMTFNSEAALLLLEQKPPNLGEARAALEAIVADGARAGAVVASLRAMFKRDTHQRVGIDVNELLQDVLKIVDTDIRSQQVLVSTELAGSLGRVFADRAQLQQVFLNLFVNAIEAMRGITDRVRLLQIKSDVIQGKSGILVTVGDSGPGIDSKDKTRILEPFFSTKATGTGIGLAICKSIVEAHGGHIRVSDNHPRGAIFHVALPDDAS